MIFAHTFIGMLVASGINPKLIKSKGFPITKQKLLIWASAMIGAIAPDFDLLYVFFIDNTAFHRNLISHALFPYILLLIIGLIIIKVKNLNTLYISLLLAFFLGIVSHLVADMFLDTVYPAKPFSSKGLSLNPFPLDKSSGLLGYFTSPYMVIEIIISLLGLSVFIKSLHKHKKEFKLLLVLLGIIQIGTIIALIPFLYKFN